MLNRFISLPLLIVLVITVEISIAADRYYVTEIGCNGVMAQALNENNEVVGHVIPPEEPSDQYAFYWSADTGIVSIGGITATDINDLGQIVGSKSMFRPGIWENGSWFTVSDRQTIEAINNSGQITGLISAQPYWIPGPYSPYIDNDIYTPGFIELDKPYDGASQGLNINENGEVVASPAVFYNTDGSYVILDWDGLTATRASGINDSQQIVGKLFDNTTKIHHAVYWATPYSDVEYMGNLGDSYSVAVSINNSGVAIGYTSTRAFVWTQAEGTLDLDTLIHPDLGIMFYYPLDINNNGAIVTQGYSPTSENCAYLLRPWHGSDADNNGIVDLADYAVLHDCLAGPDGIGSGADCWTFDSDADGDVDLVDIAAFQLDFNDQ